MKASENWRLFYVILSMEFFTYSGISILFVLFTIFFFLMEKGRKNNSLQNYQIFLMLKRIFWEMLKNELQLKEMISISKIIIYILVFLIRKEKLLFLRDRFPKLEFLRMTKLSEHLLLNLKTPIQIFMVKF